MDNKRLHELVGKKVELIIQSKTVKVNIIGTLIYRQNAGVFAVGEVIGDCGRFFEETPLSIVGGETMPAIVINL
jgi:hypothetical protein